MSASRAQGAILVPKIESVARRLAAVPTTAGLAARLAVETLKQRSVDPLPLLTRSGLSNAAINPHSRISARSQIDFLELASRAVADDFLGLTLARNVDLRELGMLYYVSTSSRCFGDALRRVERYVRIGNEAVIASVHKGSSCRVTLAYSGVPRHVDCHQMEFLALVLVRLCQHLVGQRASPLEVNFIHHRSGDVGRARELLGCEVAFGSDEDDLHFDPSLLDQSLMSEDPFLNRLMVEHCEQAMATRRTNVSSFRTLVENAIAPLLPHAEASLKKVAKVLGLSERTFARRLAAEGLSFGALLDELRRDLATRYLEEPDLQISQIAWLVGFHQPSALSHACHRWTGKSPSEYRNGVGRVE